MSRPKNTKGKKPVDGVCCGCGYSGEEETDCPGREDGIHCNHWWDADDDGPIAEVQR